MHGFLTDVQSQLIAAYCIQDIELSKVLERATSLVTGSETNLGAVAKVSTKGNKASKESIRRCYTMRGSYSTCLRKKKNVANTFCYRCGEVGHDVSKCLKT